MKIVTHNGKFHADDVFAIATLLLVYPEAEVIRTRDEKQIESADVAVDVGKIYDPIKMRFDHHQAGGAGAHENGIPYASFGLVWKEYGEKLAGGTEASASIEEKIVMAVDALDNGVFVSTAKFEGIREYSISDYFNSYWVDDNITNEELDGIFASVVRLAKDLLGREIDKARRIIEQGKAVEAIYNSAKNKRIIILDKHYAWGRVLVAKPEPLIVVYPRFENTNWGAQAIRKNLNSFETRVLFPESWAGKSGDDLVNASGVEGAVFCHNGRFLAMAESKEGAVALAEIALNS